ncbi:DJ-1/PfpI family protein [Natronomonas gomsonensis]|uniref:DJ-1/PfpI family protein n=1 Tax=Natronomonas gomsonensis TaxID=1046043 RepID=UPI0015BA0A27|nr:DJ-1/PfpI family protein [Natronomonas gomsonensis]
MNVKLLLFEGFDELDAVGPYEVFQLAGRYGCDMSAELVTLTPTDRVVARSGMRIEPHGALEGSEADFVVVPGGGWNDDGPGVRVEYDRGEIPDVLARFHAERTAVASVCTGALLLAKAGLLDGRPATTHHTALEDLREMGADVVEDRVVDDGDVLTAGGITSGFDLALHVVARECGESVAESVARELEYERAI